MKQNVYCHKINILAEKSTSGILCVFKSFQYIFFVCFFVVFFLLLFVFQCKIEFYYIQINEIQGKVLFSLVKNINSVISLVVNINLWMTSAFSISFLCNSTISLQNFRRL